jgi:putative hemolysin
MTEMQAIVLEIVIIVLLVLANGVFAMSEIAVVSARKARLQHLARAGNRRAATALTLVENPDRFLSTVQIGITAVGIFAGAFGGATIADQLDERLERIPALAPYSETIGVGVVVLAITYLSLVLGELVPKRIALSAPERIAAAVAPMMQRLARIAAPAVHLLTISTRAMFWLLRIRPREDRGVTPEELNLLLRQGMEAGTIGRVEQNIIERTFRLSDRRVRAVMTPRVDVDWIDISLPLDQIRRVVSRSAHNRLPVGEGRLDNLLGVIRGKDVWNEDVKTSDHLRRKLGQPLFVPQTTSALLLLQRFRESGNHLAAIIDEFGGFEGIVTPADILEALVGELPESGQPFEPAIVTRADGSWSVDAAVGLDELQSAIGLPLLPAQKSEFQTLAGYLVNRAGRLLQIGESMTIGDYRFEIADLDGRRIDRITITRLS